MAWRKKNKDINTRSPRDQSKRTAPVFSYYSNRAQPSAEATVRPNERMRPSVPSVKVASVAWWVRYLPSLLSLMIVVLAGLYTTTLSTKPKLNVRSVNNNSGTLLRDASEYQTAAQDLFEKSILNQSKLTLNSDKLAQQLEGRFPELGEVIVTVPLFGRKPIIEAQPANPVLLLAAKNGVYVIDSNGTAVLRANELMGATRDKLPVVDDTTDTLIELGKQALPTDTVDFISLLSYQFAEKKINNEAYTLPAIANEIHVRPTGEKYYIKFNTETDVRVQAGAYFALKQLLEGEGKPVNEYIDVRVEGRAFYK